jgi:hypothetical protein
MAPPAGARRGAGRAGRCFLGPWAVGASARYGLVREDTIWWLELGFRRRIPAKPAAPPPPIAGGWGIKAAAKKKRPPPPRPAAPGRAALEKAILEGVEPRLNKRHDFQSQDGCLCDKDTKEDEPPDLA